MSTVAVRRAGRSTGSLLVVCVVVCLLGGSLVRARSGRAAIHPDTPVEPNAVAWSELRNPVLAVDGVAVKDPTIARRGVDWVVAYSRIGAEPVRFQIGWATSRDLTSFHEYDLWDQADLGGLASPSLTQLRDGRWVVTYNSHTHDVDGSEKLYYRTSRDLTTFSNPHRLRIEGPDAPSDRLIDAAIAQVGDALYLGYKLGQSFRVARSASGSLDGPWVELGAPRVGLLENYQFVRIGGRWHLLGTKIPVHEPALFRLDGDPSKARRWLRWTSVGSLEIPPQAWNDGTGSRTGFEIANSGTLFRADDWWYLLYAGSTETKSFAGRGASSLGVARSRDLARWAVPDARDSVGDPIPGNQASIGS